jgi:hypothetical protein
MVQSWDKGGMTLGDGSKSPVGVPSRSGSGLRDHRPSPQGSRVRRQPKTMEVGSSSKSPDIEWYFYQKLMRLWDKWLLLPRSTIRRNDVLLRFPFAASFLLQLRCQILRDRNRKYEVLCPLGRLLIAGLRSSASIFPDVLRRFRKVRLGNFLIPKSFGFLTTSERNLKSSKYAFQFSFS